MPGGCVAPVAPPPARTVGEIGPPSCRHVRRSVNARRASPIPRHGAPRNLNRPEAHAAFLTIPLNGNSYASPYPASYVSRRPVGDANFVDKIPIPPSNPHGLGCASHDTASPSATPTRIGPSSRLRSTVCPCVGRERSRRFHSVSFASSARRSPSRSTTGRLTARSIFGLRFSRRLISAASVAASALPFRARVSQTCYLLGECSRRGGGS